jgi:hypothetical protein
LNLRPPGYEPDELPGCSTPRQILLNLIGKRTLQSFRFASALPFDSPVRVGGDDRDRTGDLLLAKQALSQLSYGPVTKQNRTSIRFRGGRRLVGLDGFEPSTPALSRRCSNQLSYRPAVRYVVHVWLATDRLWVQMVGDEVTGSVRGPVARSASLFAVPCFRERR